MKTTWLKICMSIGLMAILFAPAMVHADGISLNVNLGADDEAHFHFKEHRKVHPMILKAAKQLQNAKHTLWEAADDFGGHKTAAIKAINAALDELREAANSK